MRWIPVFCFFSSKSEKGGFLDRAYLLFLLRCGGVGHLDGAGWYALLAGGQLQSWLGSTMLEVFVWAWGNSVSVYLKPISCVVFLLCRNGSESSIKLSVDEVEMTALFD